MAVMAIVMTSCRPTTNKDATSAVEAAPTDTLSADELVKRVEDIYANVFQVYIHEDSLRNLDQLEGSPVWEKRVSFNNDYCTRELNELLRQVGEIDSLYHAEELGFFEADYWLMGQDWGSDLHISDVNVVSMEGAEAVVEMKIHNLGSLTPVRLKMINEGGLWKIDSFIDADNGFDLKQEMAEYVSNEKKNRQ